MKKILPIILFFVSFAAVNAQDKIITVKRDTIECRIVSVNAERISYEQKTADNLFAGNSIPTAEVLKYFRTAKPADLDDHFYHQKVRRERPDHRWIFSLQGGLSHSLTDYESYSKYLVTSGNSKTAVDDYFGKLTNGYHLATSMHYLLNTFVGLGVDYNLFYAASKGELLSRGYGQINVPMYMKLEMDERICTHFAGVSVLFQQTAGKIKISETLAPGLVMLRNESRDYQYQSYWGVDPGYGGYGNYQYGGLSYYDQANSLSTGTTFGAKGSLAIEYALTPRLSAGLAGNFVWAELKKLSVKTATSNHEDQELQNAIKLSHIDYGLIVRYNF